MTKKTPIEKQNILLEDILKKEKENSKRLRNIEIYLKYDNGISKKLLAVEYDLSTRTIGRILKDFKVSRIVL